MSCHAGVMSGRALAHTRVTSALRYRCSAPCSPPHQCGCEARHAEARQPRDLPAVRHQRRQRHHARRRPRRSGSLCSCWRGRRWGRAGPEGGAGAALGRRRGHLRAVEGPAWPHDQQRGHLRDVRRSMRGSPCALRRPVMALRGTIKPILSCSPACKGPLKVFLSFFHGSAWHDQARPRAARVPSCTSAVAARPGRHVTRHTSHFTRSRRDLGGTSHVGRTISPSRSWGSPTTTAAATPGWLASAASTCAGHLTPHTSHLHLRRTSV
jgi:hypothetical protein